VLYLRPEASWWDLFLIAYPATAAVAFLSWHLVEKRALRLKPAALGATRRPAPQPA
jgi:peptidoglycan/LPS O-acetylase OafA/YrhL